MSTRNTSHLRAQKQRRRDGVEQTYHRKGQPQSSLQERKAARDAALSRASVSASWQEQQPGDWSAKNAAPAARESFWERMKREWCAAQAHYREFRDRMALAAINREARMLEPPKVPNFQRDRLIAEGEAFRETLEWRRKTGRNMLTGEHLSGMPIDRFDEFPDGNPFEEEGEGKLKWGRQPLSVEEGRPFDLKVFDADGIYIGKRRRRKKGEPDPDPLRDEHGRDAGRWNLDGTHCDTGSIFGPDGKSKYGYNREQYFREVVLKGLTPEEATAHRAEAEQHDRVMAQDALERKWAEKYAV